VTVVDSSALIAILLQESDAGLYAEAIEVADLPVMSAATLVEAGAVALGRGGQALLLELRAIIRDAGIEVVPFTADHAERALDAYRHFGRGVGRPACLNFGDCLSYALADARDEPLLYKGDDFSRTDIRSAL
jgi:ribonuclease VapC